jgi:methionyl-tRNA formyltransferase
MRLGYFADGPWSHQALDRLKGDERFKIAFIVGRHPRPDARLEKQAKELGIPFLVDPNVNSESFRSQIDGKTDLNVSLSFNQILKQELIESAPLGFINCHAGALPFYRGRNVLNWAIINGEQQFGVTIHYVDEGIDTGDIIRQDWVEIRDSDAYGTVLEDAYTQCAKSLYAALVSIFEGKASRTPQRMIHETGFYCGGRTFGDEWINWEWPSERILNFVRGITVPGPSARTKAGDKVVGILAARPENRAIEYLGTPGEVVGRNEDGVVIKTGDSVLVVTQVADVSDEGELQEPRQPKYRIGKRLGYSLAEKMHELERRLKALESRMGE